MSFQKLTALVAFVILASQGAMATPHPHPQPLTAAAPAGPQSVADTLSDAAGTAIGIAGVTLLPENMIKQGIKGGGGKVPGEAAYPPAAPAGPEAIADNLLENSAKVLSTAGGAALPSNLVSQAIKVAGGIPGEDDVES